MSAHLWTVNENCFESQGKSIQPTTCMCNCAAEHGATEADGAFLKWQRHHLLPNVFSSFQELFGCCDDVVRWWQRMQEVLMRRTLWWGSKQDELLMKDKKHWNPSEYVGIFLVSNTNILGTEKWVTPTPHKLFSSCHDSRTSVVPWSLSPWDRANDLSGRDDKVSAFVADLLMGRVIRALREYVKHFWVSSNKSSSPVLSPPICQQSLPKTT